MAGPAVTGWIYAALMLIPFALLVPIAQALPAGRVWPALIVLPWAGIDPPLRPRAARPGFNPILVQTVKCQSLFSLLLSLGLVL